MKLGTCLVTAGVAFATSALVQSTTSMVVLAIASGTLLGMAAWIMSGAHYFEGEGDEEDGT